ncbi:hypothetical protein OQA88_3910 [Cercophora sp. LCS_1]
MAATIGPDMMVDASSADSFGHDTTRGFTIDHIPSQDSSLASPQMSPRSTLPPPNPPFVFPSRPSSYSAPSSFSRATGRRPRSAIESKEPALVIATDDENKSRSPALPAFSFNPGASLPPAPAAEHAFLIPPKSPSAPDSPRSAPVRPGGHRRGGSEFVGGSIRGGDAVTVLGTSPTKSESGMASPMLQPTKPSRPRGHAHRRSAAISSHDLSSIILPSPGQNLRGSSAPASPAILHLDGKDDFPAPKSAPPETTSGQSPFYKELNGATVNEVPISAAAEVEPSSKPPARNRVGFSDTLEFIPRPLSLVSNETSSTITARPGHSVSGSISSVISITQPDRELHSPVGLSPVRNMNDTRPSTAGAILERTQSSQEAEPLPSPRRRGSIPFLGVLPSPSAVVDPATPSPTKSIKKWSFFGLDPFVASSPTRSRPLSASSSESQKEPSPPTQDVAMVDASPETEPLAAGDLKPITKKRSKKQKKVKTWAGSILSRKSKARHAKQKRKTSTPPPFSRVSHAPETDFSDTMDMSAEPESGLPSLLVTDSTSDGADDGWNPASESDEDTSYPMIDLDAALGPFNTPLPRNPEWEAAQRAGGLVKKQLHSAAGMSRFSGPGMHYHHRRAESAPEMAPFEAGRLGFPRFGSSSTMADVFEEDEEDEDHSAKSTGQSTPVAETPVTDKPAPLDSEPQSDAVSIESTHQQKSTGDDRVIPVVAGGPDETRSSVGGGLMGTPTRFNRSATSLHDQGLQESPAHIVIPVSRCSLDSATPSPRHIMRPKELAPVDVPPLNLPSASLAPISPYSMTQSSAFPSPRSPMSYDAHRISTAPSSITEDNFQSLLMGEPGPEVRVSVDIPSLTSSNSTMTRESIFAQHPQARPAPLGSQPRPASFTSTAFGRRRSSLASLSRLISSSHGERSKLSMEVPMNNEPEKKGKVSKTKRLSRLVQFWKTKEVESA